MPWGQEQYYRVDYTATAEISVAGVDPMSGLIKYIVPGMSRRIISISATAGNVVTEISPGAGRRMIILGGRISLTTDATVADRYVAPDIKDGNNNILVSIPKNSTAITASSSGTVNLGLFFTDGIAVSGRDSATIPLPFWILVGTDKFTITIQNGTIGDSYSGYVVVLEANEI